MSAPQIPKSVLRCPCPRCCFLALAATAAPHIWLFLTHNCSRASICIIGTCIRAARARWTLSRPCRHLRYQNPYSDAYVPDAAFWPGPPLLPHILGCYSCLTARVCPFCHPQPTSTCGLHELITTVDVTSATAKLPTPAESPRGHICSILACAATAAPHIWLFLTLNCSRASIYIIGTCIRCARASWTLLWPCRHLRY